MSVEAVPMSSEPRAAWLPMGAIALGQVIMSLNVASLPGALGGTVVSFNVPPTTVAGGYQIMPTP